MENKFTKREIELLSPAGTMESVISAVTNGCNAIYVGGKNFGARSSSKNFTNEELYEVIDYCHLRGVKVYITTNTLFKNSELKDVFDFISDIYSYGADAFIMQDLGVASKLLEFYPEIVLHASTQMTAHCLEDVLFLQEMGFKRVVLSRELSLSEIEHIHKNCEVELEAFVHGALCVSYSGQCLMSSFIGQRSANKGKCAQPCRLDYDLTRNNEVIKQGCLLSPKDLLSVDILDEIILSGITSLKIEGRMKSEQYVATTTKYYNERLLSIKAGKKNDAEIQHGKEKLISIFNRGGSSTGYFKNYSSQNMMSTISPKHTGLCIGEVVSFDQKTNTCTIKLNKDIVPGDGLEIWTSTPPHVGAGINKPQKSGELLVIRLNELNQKQDFSSKWATLKGGEPVYKSFDKALNDEAKKIVDTRKITINSSVKCIKGEEFLLSLSYNGLSSEVKGDTVEKATNKPLPKDEILDRLNKTGGTTFELNFVNVEVDDDIFMPISKLNGYRRDALELIKDEIIAGQERLFKKQDVEILKDDDAKFYDDKKISILVSNEKQLETVLNSEIENAILYVEINNFNNARFENYFKICNQKNIKLYISLPYLNRYDDIAELKEEISLLENTAISGFLVRTLGELYLLSDTTKQIVTDYSLNVANRLSYDFLKKYCNRVSVSQELHFEDINAISGKFTEIIIHGKPKVMITSQCPVGLYAGEKGNERFCKLKNNSVKFSLLDRTNAELPIIRDCKRCFAKIYKDRPISLLTKYDELENFKVSSLRISFTDETAVKVSEICNIVSDLFMDKNFTKAKMGLELFAHDKDAFNLGNFFKGSI